MALGDVVMAICCVENCPCHFSEWGLCGVHAPHLRAGGIAIPSEDF